MSAVPQTNLSDRAYAETKALIQRGAFGMGEKLGEERICGMTGLSRTPVRAALARLEAEGLVEREPGRGHRLPVYTLDDVREIYGCRALLEAEAVRLAAQRRLPPAVERALDGLVAAMDDLLAAARDRDVPDLRGRFLTLNHAFHNLIYDNCGSAQLRRLIANVSDLPLSLRSFFNFSGAQLMESHASHQNILAALKQGDGERAAALMREHIWSARDRMEVARPARRVRARTQARSPRGKLILTPRTPPEGTPPEDAPPSR